MPDENFYTWFTEYHKKQHFTFPEIPALDKIVFERLRQGNAEALYQIFKNDHSPFVDERFKQLDKATDYAKYLDRCGAYTPKHGSADWLFCFNNDDHIGILHLYDLSLKTFAQNHRRAWIGFATKAIFRRQGIASKVVRHFIQTIFSYYSEINFIHTMTDKENKATASFLRACGFLDDPAERLSKDDSFFILSRRDLS